MASKPQRLDIEVTCPPAVFLDCSFANGRSFQCAPGSTEVFTQVTGDEYGYMLAQFEGAKRAAKQAGALDREVDGGGIKVIAPKDYDTPPAGSKKALKLAADAEGEKAAKKAARIEAKEEAKAEEKAAHHKGK